MDRALPSTPTLWRPRRLTRMEGRERVRRPGGVAVFECGVWSRSDSRGRWSEACVGAVVLACVCAVLALFAPGAIAAVAVGGVGSVAPGCPRPAAASRRAVVPPVAGLPAVAPPVAALPVAVPDARVTTGDQLVAALCAGKKYIWIENGARIDLAKVTPMEPDCPAPGDDRARGAVRAALRGAADPGRGHARERALGYAGRRAPVPRPQADSALHARPGLPHPRDRAAAAR